MILSGVLNEIWQAHSICRLFQLGRQVWPFYRSFVERRRIGFDMFLSSALLFVFSLELFIRYVDYKTMKKLLKPLENGKGSKEEETLFVEALFNELQKVFPD